MENAAVKTYQYIILCLACTLSIMMILSAADLSFADPQKAPPGKVEIAKPGGGKENCRGKYPGDLLAVVVPCIRETVQNTTEQMTDEFDEFLKAPAVAFMTLVVTLFGVKLLMNEGDVKKQGVLLLFKIAGVFLFLDNFGGFIPAVFGTIIDASDMVTNSLGGALANVECNTGEGEKPWSYLDCVLGTLFGFAPGLFLGASVFGIMGAALWSGQFGAVLFMGTLSALFFVFRLIVRAVYTYLMALVIVGFLIVISPLLIPLLMMGPTFQYFEHWLRALMSTMIQPVIVLAYMTLCFSVLDKIMFDDEIGLAKTMDKEQIKKMWEGRSKSGALSSLNDATKYYQKNKFDVEKLKKEIAHVSQNPLGSGFSGFSVDDLYTVDFRDKRASKAQKAFFSMAALVVVAYILDLMLEALIQLAQQILGGGFALGSATRTNPIEDKMKKMQQGMMQSFTGNKSANSAKGFAAAIPGALSAGLAAMRK